MIKYKNILKTANPINNKSGNQAQIVTSGMCNNKDIAQEMEKVLGIPASRTMSVLDEASQIITQMLLDGKVINLEGLGFLKANLSFEDGRPVAKKMQFQVSNQLREALDTATFEEVTEG